MTLSQNESPRGEQADRPLPALLPETARFWTSGAEGVLTVKGCAACDRLLHPSVRVCPGCFTGELGWREVSGRAYVVGITVNHQQWSPAIPPPYVVAIVALDEDPRVRLTTNLVDVEPNSARVGDAVEVRFHQIDDVWLPVFAPDPGRSARVTGVELPARFIRTPASDERFEDRVAITGIGMSKIGRRLLRTGASLAADACRAAIADAGLTLADIDGLSTYPGPPAGPASEGGVNAVVEALGIRPTWHSGGPETSGQTGSVVNAMLAVATGLCRHVLCFRTVTEATHTHRLRTGAQLAAAPARLQDEMMTWRVPFGAWSAANWIAMAASQYQHRFGLERETLGWIALNARANAALNEHAVYREPLTMQEYLNARMVTTPFGLYDCDVPCDGSIAVIVSRRDAALDCRHRAVHVAAVGTGISERQSWDQGTITHEPNVFGPASHLWTRTDLTPADVDVAELYDGFTFNCLTWLEALGFCPVGEAAAFLDGGQRIALNGELPLNTHGGQLSAGRTHGYGFLHEAVVQLRGTAGIRQVSDAEIAVVASGGGTPGGCLLLVRS
jgi:acetyl-CoA acetyltransferase/uncharacterized OB-fold protein